MPRVFKKELTKEWVFLTLNLKELFLQVDPPQATRAVHQVFENFEVIFGLTPDPLLEDDVGGVISDVSDQNLIPPLEG
jgi:hypothetical protein